jgi:hypothetical protein
MSLVGIWSCSSCTLIWFCTPGEESLAYIHASKLINLWSIWPYFLGEYICQSLFDKSLVSRRQTYCTGHSSGMGLSVFSARDGLVRERVDDGSVGAIDISRFRCPGLSGLKNIARLAPVWF